MDKKIPLLFLGMLILGTIGSFAVDDHWVEVVANHLGGLGVVGLLACLAAYIARKRGRNHRRAFVLGILPPIALGVIAVILVMTLTEHVYCGGGVILAAALAVVIGYTCLKKKQVASHA
jgi:hypothetical protein